MNLLTFYSMGYQFHTKDVRETEASFFFSKDFVFSPIKS